MAPQKTTNNFNKENKVERGAILRQGKTQACISTKPSELVH